MRSITVPKERLDESELEEGEDADARFLRVTTTSKHYGRDTIEYRSHMQRDFDVNYEVWINGALYLSGKASQDTEMWQEFQLAAQQVRAAIIERLLKLRTKQPGVKVRRDAGRLFEQ